LPFVDLAPLQGPLALSPGFNLVAGSLVLPMPVVLPGVVVPGAVAPGAVLPGDDMPGEEVPPTEPAPAAPAAPPPAAPPSPPPWAKAALLDAASAAASIIVVNFMSSSVVSDQRIRSAQARRSWRVIMSDRVLRFGQKNRTCIARISSRNASFDSVPPTRHARLAAAMTRRASLVARSAVLRPKRLGICFDP
jgi:hypothetical protein